MKVELISPMTVMSDEFWVTRATTAQVQSRSFMRSTIAFSTCEGVLPAAGTRPA